MIKGNNRSGFTLVELAIVLVIIGLIVGGVLVGQDLIKAATIRAAVSQLERYDTAANAFRNKYNGLPGDLANPTAFFSAITNAGGNGSGDGDGLVEGITAAASVCTTHACIAGENTIFWYQLNQAGMISDAATTTNATAVTLTVSDSVLPQSKLGRGARVHVQSFSGRNYYILGNFGSAALVDGGVAQNFTAALSPIDALQIDTKMDDSVPNTGKALSIVVASAVPTTPGNSTPSGTGASTACFVAASDTATPAVYFTTTYNSNNATDLINCSMGIRTSF